MDLQKESRPELDRVGEALVAALAGGAASSADPSAVESELRARRFSAAVAGLAANGLQPPQPEQ